MFAHLQQPSPSAPNLFGLQSSQQSQTSNIFGQKAASPFQSQTSQSTSNPFGQTSASQNQSSTNIFGKPATSPIKDGDSMSTTPDTSPQANNDRTRLGPFASATAPSKEALTNGTTPAGPGSSFFGGSFQPSGGQGAELTNGEASSNEGWQGNNGQASDESLGSPTKKSRTITQSKVHVEDKTPSKNPFASITFPPPQTTTPASPFSFSSSPAPSQKPSSASSQPSESTLSNSAKSALGTAPAQRSAHSRKPGEPPEPPAHWTDDMKRQLITGWRLKSLDVGFQSYLRNSTFDKAEFDSVKEFYELRKRAIFDADGGPLPVIRKKRAAGTEQPQTGLQSKKARHEQPASTGDPPTDKGNLGKRKADDILQESDDGSSTNSLKRSKGDGNVAYPSLPPASASQTSKLFGNLVHKQGSENASEASDPAVNGHSSPDDTLNDPAPASKPSSSQSDLFFKAPITSAADSFFEPSAFGYKKDQTSFFNLGKESSSTPLQSKSEKANVSGQAQPTQSTTPFGGFVSNSAKPSTDNNPSKGFFSWQTNNGNGVSTASGGMSTTAQGFGTAQSSSTSSIFSGLNSGATQETNAKRKADDEGDPDESSPPRFEEQPSKKQRAGEVLTGNSDSGKGNNGFLGKPTTAEGAGFGRSIFERPNQPSANILNPFAKLAESSNPSPDDDDDGDEDAGENEKEVERKNTVSTTNQTPKLSGNDRSKSPIYNPFANATFPPSAPPTQSTGGEKPAGRSMFDRIQKDDNGQPAKDPETATLGENILKTPAGQKAGSIFDQAKFSASNPFGATNATNPTFGNSIFGNKGSNAAKSTPSAVSTSNIFGTPSGANTAPTANMVGNKDTGGSPSGDNTWKPETPIKFGNTTNASPPAINFTSPSPAKPPFAGLFGASKPSASSESASPFNFKPADSTSAKSASLTFGISAPAKDSNDLLAPPSGTQSESTSRATSPGGTDNEGVGESSDVTHDEESTPQLDAAEAAKAEADEDIVFEAKAKLYKYDTSAPDKANHKWVMQGLDQFKVLKHRDTNKTRVLMRLKNGRIILNAGLQKNLSYEHAANKRVKFPVPANGKIETWMVMLGKDESAKTLTDVLEEHKAY